MIIPTFQTYLTETDGTRLTVTSETASCHITLDTQPIENGYACYVDAHTDKGLAGEDSLLIVPSVPDTGDYVAIQNHSDFWCRPFWGRSLTELPARVQLLLLRRKTGYACYLPVCDDTFKTVIRGCESGMAFCVYSNCDGLTDCRRQLAFLYMEGSDPDALLDAITQKAAILLDNGLKTRAERRMPEVFEYLGWCSWDALHIHVSHQGLLEKAQEFQEKGLPVHYAIIDDMWADVPNLLGIPVGCPMGEMVKTMHNSPLRSFEGDPVRFPQGMKAAVDDLKKAGIPKVGIWFPTTGYWKGLMPDGPEAKRMKDDLVMIEEGRLLVSPTPKEAFDYFDTFCRRIRSWGGDFVKIDNQGCHKRYRNLSPIGQSARALQNAIDSTTGYHFDGALINCMGMPSECMFNRRNSPISRCSDDFQPESREWFSKNILQCAYNGLLQGRYYINDWDMWWSDDEQAVKNSVCRALSGGPVYVSDKIGRTDPAIFKPLIFGDGRLLRCDDSATPTHDCLFDCPTESGRIFKIRNRSGKAGLVAAFNIDRQNRSLTGTLCPEDAGLPAGRYAYYEYFTKQAGILEAGASLPVTLENNDIFRLYTFVPFDENGIAVLGRTDKYIGVKAVTAKALDTVTLYEGGELKFVTEKDIVVAVSDGVRQLPAVREGHVYTVCLPAETTSVRLTEVRD